MNLTATAPGTSQGVPGLSDRGQQFWMMAETDTHSVQSFVWGTAVRASDGSMAYTQRGTCDVGVFDQQNSLVALGVSLNKLNVYASPPIGPGSVLCGLRGQTLEPGTSGSRDPLRDHARGGGTFTFEPCGPVPALLVSFDAQSVEQGILLRWQFASGADLRSVQAQRAEDPSGDWTAPAMEYSAEGALSTALDRTAEPGRTYYYRLLTSDAGGTERVF